MYDRFEQLNRETREYNNRNVDRFNTSTKSNYSKGYDWLSYYNNQTYKQNNNQYSNYYMNR